jgi:patatin-like phospholipase
MPYPRDVAYPKALREAEAQLIEARREKLRGAQADPGGYPLPASAGDRGPPASEPWGLALSGGGVRSATFCLGVLQGLARTGLLRRFDFLSTVSGGGFIGGFLGLAIQRREADTIYQELEDNASPTMKWFRENGRYLTPNGMVDLWGAAATMLRNWFSVHVVVASTLLALMLLGQFGRILAYRSGGSLISAILPAVQPGDPFQLVVSPWIWLAVLLTLVWLAPTAWAYWLTQRSPNFIPPFAACLLTVVGALYATTGLAAEDGARLTPLYHYLVLAVGAVASLAFFTWAAVIAWVYGWRVRYRTGLGLASLATLSGLLPIGVLAASVAGWFPWLLTATGLTTSLVLPFIGGSTVVMTMDDENDRARRRLVRNALSQLMTSGLIVLGILLGVSLIDTMGLSVYQWLSVAWPGGQGLSGGLVTLLVSLFPIVSALIPWVQRAWGVLGARIKLSTSAFISAAAVLLLGFYLSGLSVLAFALGQGGAPLTEPPVMSPWLLFWLAATVLCAVVVSRLFGFVNTSSLHDFYVSRLNRTYLGASNPERLNNPRPVTQALSGDDEQYPNYQPYASGGPLHLINVTFNETVSGQSQTEQQDRHGLPLAVGPGGLSLGVKRHALWKKSREEVESLEPKGPRDDPNYQIWPSDVEIRPEVLSLGYWTGISGAAFTTGTGFRTTVGTSLLAGLFNVRLGYWWDSGVNPGRREGEPRPTLGTWVSRLLSALAPVQVALLDEFMARFHGPARRRWYLSDGGHFENTAVYELIRRRLPVIVACDCGADPTFCFEDLGRLVRLARTDFGARIRFLRDAERLHAARELARTTLLGLGSLKDLVPHKAKGHPLPLSNAHMAVGQITWDGSEDKSLIVILKPTLTPDVPADLLEYHCRHTDFPQQPTTDQFFDENQWECYRELGSEIGGMVGKVLEPDAIKALHLACGAAS